MSSGESPGLIAFEKGEPVGWCAFGPRQSYPTLGRSRVVRAVDDRPVWSVVCFFVARPHRRRGLSVQLLRAAADHARRRGARILEGYPIDANRKDYADAFAWTGLVKAFEQAGFREIARRSPGRPIMRRALDATT